MILSTVLNLLLVPVLYILIISMRERFSQSKRVMKFGHSPDTSMRLIYMKKTKIFILFLAINLVINTNIALSAESQKDNDSTVFKETVEDQRLNDINKDWWDKFHYPILKGYILKTVKDNYDLKIAILKTRESQAAVRESLGKEFPSVTTGDNYTRERYSGNASLPPGPPYAGNIYTFPLNVNYELDLWKKNRETTIGAEADLEATKYDEKATYISLCSQVATAYFNVINADKKIQLQKDIIELRKSIYDLTKNNNKYGLTPTTDVIIADRDLTEAQSDMNDLEKQRSTLLDQLATLIGESPINSDSLKRSSIDDVELIKNLPQTIESKIVQSRPDILKAEAQLQKSKINVDLAKKDFLPDISITGTYGFNSFFLAKAFDWSSYIASVGVNLGQGIFQGGQKVATFVTLFIYLCVYIIRGAFSLLFLSFALALLRSLFSHCLFVCVYKCLFVLFFSS